MSKLKSRYPGARPFESEQQLIFRGRQQDIEAVFRLIQLESLVVVYGKSGTGKSSLFNAGIMPKVKAETDLLPVRVRFNAYREGEPYVSPAETARQAVRERVEQHDTFLDRILPETHALWHDVKEHYIRHEGQKGLLLVIDQFEELFTYPQAEVQDFAEQLAEAVFKTVPQRYWDALQTAYDRGEKPLGPEALALFQHKPAVKVALTIRSDRVHLLNRIDEALPVILKNLYELDALTPESAALAITEPAAMPMMDWFDTEPFLYAPAAVQKIIDHLTFDKNAEGTAAHQQKIEATQLQIICAEVEERVRKRHLAVVQAEHLGDLDAIIKRYYDTQIAKLDPEEQLPARKLIEDGLIFEEEERRLSLYEGQIFKSYHLQPETLRKLVDAHLLRAEPSIVSGGYTYELSHDTLVAPVLAAKRVRVEAERREEEARLAVAREAALAAEKAEIERRRRRALVTALVAGVLVMGALVATVVAWRAIEEANRQKAIAQEKETVANEAIQQQEAAKSELEAQIQVAEESRFLFEQAKAAADTAIAQSGRDSKRAQEAIALAEVKKQEAARASLLAVAALLEQDRQDIWRLNYDKAYEKIKKAEALARSFGPESRAMRDSVVYELMEIAFFHHETGNSATAREALNKAADLSGNNITGLSVPEALRRISKDQYGFLEARYFPNMQPISGGVFGMGRDTSVEENGGEDELPRHQVNVSDFDLAETETTFWQWNVYVTDKKRSIQRYSPGWGLYGDNPVVNLDWFDACEYANWLSDRAGLDAWYKIDSSAGRDNRRAWNVTLQSGTPTGYRLPFEAEWEYAARGGAGAPYLVYAGSNDLKEVGWYNENATLDGIRRTMPVKQKKPVVFGNGSKCYDMSGNVWEWCWDWYSSDYYKEKSLFNNPVGPDAGDYRVVRGGSWFFYDNYCRSAYRYYVNPNFRYNNFGFRCARGGVAGGAVALWRYNTFTLLGFFARSAKEIFFWGGIKMFLGDWEYYRLILNLVFLY